MDPTFLQIFLLFNVFLIGALAAIAAQHAYVHFKPHSQKESRPRPTPQGGHLPPEVREHLLQESQAHFQAVLNRSADELQHDLKATTEVLDKQLEKLGSEILADEMKRYRASLDQLRAQAETTITTAQTEIADHQTDLKSKLAERHAELEAKLLEEMDAEKQRLIQQIDTKLSDAVASFLMDTLQHNVDLGAQTAYLTSMLEEHKSELVKGISDEA
jgi:uncharacterized membrane protein